MLRISGGREGIPFSCAVGEDFCNNNWYTAGVNKEEEEEEGGRRGKR